SVYVDHNGSRGFEPATDAPAAHRLVFIDMNASGSFDIGEPLAVTGDDGTAVFDQLTAGDYAVGLLTNPETQAQVEPTSVAPSAVWRTAAASERLLHNSDFSSVWSVESSGVITAVTGVTSD